MAKIYKLSISPESGLLSKIHSDTTFGHLCWRLKEEQGEESLISFLNLFKSGKPIFTLSNAFYEKDNNIFFPKPMVPPVPNSYITKKDKIKSFMDYKKSKKVKFITLSQLNSFLNAQNINMIPETIDYPKIVDSLRTSVKIDRSTFSSEEGKLYTYNPIYFDEKTNLCIFIKIIDEDKFKEYDCENLLKEIFNIGYGRKKSSGYGHFRFINYSLFDGFNEPESSDGFISLSNYIPDSSDNVYNYYYDFTTKFGKLGEDFSMGDNPFKFPIILLTEGSIFYTKENKEFYGRLTNPGDLHNDKRIVQNGFAFSLKLKIKL